jgi:hypothetical protein
MDPAKLKGIADWPTPKCVRDVRAFLGFTGFYRYFVPNYSRIACPLIQLTQKNTPFHWWEPHMKAFETLKTLMCRRPILRQPDYNKPFFLATDTSSYSVGAVLSQEGETNPRTLKIMHHLIVRNVHGNGAQLRHLRTRTPRSDESPTPLETTCSGDRNSGHHTHRPHQPNSLESTKKGKPKSGTMVWRTAGIQPSNPTRTRKTPHSSRHALASAKKSKTYMYVYGYTWSKFSTRQVLSHTYPSIRLRPYIHRKKTCWPCIVE